MACRKRKGGTGGTGPAQFKLLRKIVKPRFVSFTLKFPNCFTFYYRNEFYFYSY